MQSTSLLCLTAPRIKHIQSSEVITYVIISNGKCSDEESLVDFIISHQETERGFQEEMSQKLNIDGLDIQNCHGQGFYTVQTWQENMSAFKYLHLSQLNDLAKFVPCAAHSLSLVGVHAAQVSVRTRSFFGKV